jgi:MFS transporter, PHS family, inorganic phosphate transporter
MLAVQKTGNSAYHNVDAVYSHIMDPNERRRMALAEIDKAPLSWYHLRLVVVTGVGFFTDAYTVRLNPVHRLLSAQTNLAVQLFAINLATTMLGMVYWHDHRGVMPQHAATAIKVATSAGTIFGQIVFGYLADLWGRKKMYGIELLIIISATLAESLCGSSQALSIVGVMVFWRLVMGIGVGGDYPLSAVITSEMADTKWRGAMVGAVFAMQGLGQFVAAMMALIVTYGYRDTLTLVPTVAACDGACRKDVDVMWRIVLGFGGVPGWFALYYRLTIPETPRYTFDVKHDLEKAAADNRAFLSGRRGDGRPNRIVQATNNQDMLKYYQPPPSFKEFCRYFSKTKHLLTLIGTTGSWFFLDIAFYGLNLNTSQILNIIGFSGKGNVYELLHNAAVGQLVLTCAGAIPGYWMTVAVVDWVGRKPIQLGGFAVLTLIFAIIGFGFDHLNQSSLLALYIFAQFFFNFGTSCILLSLAYVELSRPP